MSLMTKPKSPDKDESFVGSIPRPERPKKPLNGYNLFVQQYAQKHKQLGSRLTGRDIFRGAADEWRTMPLDEKQSFSKQVLRNQNHYKKQLEEYKAEVQVLKSPPNSYAIFVRSFWDGMPREGENLNFVTMSRKCASAWKGLTEIEKESYKEESKRLGMIHNQMLKTLEHANWNKYPSSNLT